MDALNQASFMPVKVHVELAQEKTPGEARDAESHVSGNTINPDPGNMTSPDQENMTSPKRGSIPLQDRGTVKLRKRRNTERAEVLEISDC